MIFAGRRPLPIPCSGPPTLLVVIDTEEEFDWSAPFDRNSTQVHNIREQPLAQAILDAHAIRPTFDHSAAWVQNASSPGANQSTTPSPSSATATRARKRDQPGRGT